MSNYLISKNFNTGYIHDSEESRLLQGLSSQKFASALNPCYLYPLNDVYVNYGEYNIPCCNSDCTQNISSPEHPYVNNNIIENYNFDDKDSKTNYIYSKVCSQVRNQNTSRFGVDGYGCNCLCTQAIKIEGQDGGSNYNYKAYGPNGWALGWGGEGGANQCVQNNFCQGGAHKVAKSECSTCNTSSGFTNSKVTQDARPVNTIESQYNSVLY